jgi:hypothetical protein
MKHFNKGLNGNFPAIDYKEAIKTGFSGICQFYLRQNPACYFEFIGYGEGVVSIIQVSSINACSDFIFEL